MPLNHFAVFVYPEGGIFSISRCTAEPAASMAAAGAFCGLQGRFGRGMGKPSAGVFGLSGWPSWQVVRILILAVEDVVRDLGDGWGNKNGVMWVHGPKGKRQMCQTVAASK